MKPNLNETPRYGITPEMADAMFERTNEQAMADHDARLRAAEWPANVESVLASLGRRSRSQADALAAIDARIAKVEAALGITKA